MMKARIYRPAKNAMQSGRAGTGGWRLECEPEGKRTPESLMGWTGADDTRGQIILTFPTAEDAAAFARERGWNYTVSRPHERRIRPRNYGDNFKAQSPLHTSEAP